MAKRTKHTKPHERQFLRAQVVARKQISPSFVRVTVGGEELRSFVPMGYDQWFRFFIPGPSGELRLPTQTSNLWYAQYMLMSKETRPVGRNYTVRAYRSAGLHSAGPEIDIDFALHADESGQLGAAAGWAAAASEGDELGLFDEGITYQPTEDAAWQLLIGDETALPAILGILESAPRDLKAQAFIEVPHAEDSQEADLPEGVQITWLARSAGAPTALEAVQAATLPDGPGYAFIAGGQKLATGLRRHLVNDRKMPKEAVTFTGYWR
jgi:NADPH-dependent ferric siderophore reductase